MPQLDPRLAGLLLIGFAPMSPIVSESLADVGAIRAYEEAIGRYRAVPFVPDARADLGAWVVEKGMDGIFFHLAREEAAIRRDPAERSTELLRRGTPHDPIQPLKEDFPWNQWSRIRSIR